MRFGFGTLRVNGSQSSNALMMALFGEIQRAGRSAGGRDASADDPVRTARMRDLQAAIRIFRDEASDAPDLLKVLPRGSADRGWLRELHDTVVQSVAAGAPMLMCCEHERMPDGDTLSLAVVHLRARAEVRAGDVVRAGLAAISHRAGEVSIAPRLYRVRCTNGSITALGDGEAQRCTEETVAEAARACLSGTVFEGEVARLRQAASTRIEDPERLLLEAQTHSRWSEVREAFEREGDQTAWGLINALTAVARFSPTWSERLKRERDVAGILALLECPVPQGLRALALELPREARGEAMHAGAGAFALR